MDRFLISLFQSAYDWIWDQTGIYKGQILTGYGVCVVGYFLVHWEIARAVVCFGFIAYGAVWTQLQKRSQRKSNSMTDWYRDGWASRVFRNSVLILTALTILGAPWRATSLAFSEYLLAIGLYLFDYLATVYVRDRNPPEKRSFAYGV